MAERPRVPEDRTRRRFARRQWARRWRLWRLALVAVALVGLVVGATWLVFFSQVLAVQGITVTGNDRLSQTQVRSFAAVPEGEQLARLDVHAIRARLEAVADVRSADVTRSWPDRVRIDVVERQAVAVVTIGGRLRGLDEEGVVFREFTQVPPGMPQVRTTATADTDALREAAQVVSALPDDLSAKVDHILVETVDQISLVLRDERVVIWGSAEESDLKAEVIRAALEAQDGRTYDVSVPGSPTVS